LATSIEVDTGDLKAAACQLDAVDTDPAADFQERAAAAFETVEEIAQVIVPAIAPGLDLIEVGRRGTPLLGVILVVDVTFPKRLNSRYRRAGGFALC
jgi:hypothetical protein